MADAPEEWETAESNLSCFAYQYYHRATDARDKPGFLCFPILPTGHGRTRQIWVALHTSITNRPQPHVTNLGCFAYLYYQQATSSRDKPRILCLPVLPPGHGRTWQSLRVSTLYSSLISTKSFENSRSSGTVSPHEDGHHQRQNEATNQTSADDVG